MNEDDARLLGYDITERGQAVLRHVVRRYIDGASLEEIAEDLRIPVSAIQLLTRVANLQGVEI